MRDRLRRLAARLRPGEPGRDFAREPGRAPGGSSADLAALEAAWPRHPLAALPDDFALVRVLGADLEPRHRRGQTRENLAFVLAHEPKPDRVTRLWVANRIADREEEAAILALLDAHGEPWLRIPFVAEDYARAGWDRAFLPPGLPGGPDWELLGEGRRERLTLALYRAKNAYAMNNNGARNAALEAGRAAGAKWVLPWDGNCFLTEAAWAAIREGVAARPWLPYHVVPMARAGENAALLDPGFAPDPVEEPQILFRRDATERFAESFVYGRRPKVELFWRLGVAGPWDEWRDDPWDPPRPPRSPEAGAVGRAGWVARLGSGAAALEVQDQTGFIERGVARRQAIIAALDRLDARFAPPPDPLGPDLPGLAFYDRAALAALAAGPPDATLRAALREDAETALGRGPWSVVDKTTLPPSGEKRDYWHPAPYWHPNGILPGGKPYLPRDGRRVPGTRLHEPGSERYDRSRLQLLFDDTTALALAAEVEGREDFAAHAARLIETWFVAPETAMTPHLRYAQVRLGWNRNEGTGTGVIELKDLYYMLDAARLLEARGALSPASAEGLRDWLARYLGWLEASPQGARERGSPNNHAVYHDLQVAAIAFHLGDRARLRDALLAAEARLPRQIAEDGSQPEELARPISAHYCHFTLQGWLGLARIGRRSRTLAPDLALGPWSRLGRGLAWTLARGGSGETPGRWPFRQIDAFDPERRLPLAAHARELGARDLGPGSAALLARDFTRDRPRFPPHDGIAPYWALSAPPPGTTPGTTAEAASPASEPAPEPASEPGR